MIYLPTEALNEGMVLAENVHIDASFLPLLTRGQILSESIIRRIKQKDISGVYVEANFCDDIAPKSVINPQLRRRVISGIKDMFDVFARTTEFTSANVASMSGLARDLVMDILSNDEILINMIELKDYDNYTYYHSLCVAIISVAIGVRLGFSTTDLYDLATSALMHDIGKTVVPNSILNKPDKLTREEFEVIKDHPLNGYVALSQKRMFNMNILSGIRSHHEKYNGTGYPNHLKGHDIPLYARILAVADVYDALTSRRPYRKACFPKEAIEYMMGCSDTHFQSEILSAFLRSVAAYPSGTLVTLSNGAKAVVVKTFSENTLRPLVRIIHEDTGENEDIDLLHDAAHMNLTITGLGYDTDNSFATAEVVCHMGLTPES